VLPGTPLGISFSPFGQPDQNQQGAPGARPVTAQDAIRILSFRPPRTVGASSPVAAPLLNSPGSVALGGFGPAGQDLDSLLALILGLRKPMKPGGGGTFNEHPPSGELTATLGAGTFGSGQTSQPPPADAPMPWIRPSVPLPGFTFEKPPVNEGDPNLRLPPAYGGPGQPAGPPSAGPLPWEGPIERGDRFKV